MSTASLRPTVTEMTGTQTITQHVSHTPSFTAAATIPTMLPSLSASSSSTQSSSQSAVSSPTSSGLSSITFTLTQPNTASSVASASSAATSTPTATASVTPTVTPTPLPTPVPPAKPPANFIGVALALPCPPSVKTLAEAQANAAKAFTPGLLGQLGFVIAKQLNLTNTSVTVQGATAVQIGGSRALSPQLAERLLSTPATFKYELDVVIDQAVAKEAFQKTAGTGLTIAEVAAKAGAAITESANSGNLFSALPISVVNKIAEGLGVTPAAFLSAGAFSATVPISNPTPTVVTVPFALSGLPTTAIGATGPPSAFDSTGMNITQAAQGYIVSSFKSALSSAGSGSIVSLASLVRLDTGAKVFLAYRLLSVASGSVAGVFSVTAPTEALAAQIATLATTPAFLTTFQANLKAADATTFSFFTVAVTSVGTPAAAPAAPDNTSATIGGAVAGGIVGFVFLLALWRNNVARETAKRAAAEGAPAAAAPAAYPSAYPALALATAAAAYPPPPGASPSKGITLRAADAVGSLYTGKDFYPPQPSAYAAAADSLRQLSTVRVASPLKMDSAVARELPPTEFIACVAAPRARARPRPRAPQLFFFL